LIQYVLDSNGGCDVSGIRGISLKERERSHIHTLVVNIKTRHKKMSEALTEANE